MEYVRYRKEGQVARVTFDRPDRLNAMNQGLMSAAVEKLEVAAVDEDVLVVILSGEGRAFSVGGDLSEGAGGGVADVDVDAAVARMGEYVRASQLLIDMPKVTIAEINGACAGAALALACACDLRFASSNALFTTAFLTAGLPGDYGGTWTLSRIVGPARARQMYFLPERLSAAEALDIGLVHAVLDGDELQAHLRSVVEKLVASPPLALKNMKRNLNDALVLGFAELLDIETRRQIECARSEDAAEAAQAFIEKRSPTFVGR